VSVLSDICPRSVGKALALSKNIAGAEIISRTCSESNSRELRTRENDCENEQAEY
jgi:hypothetical protein